MPQTYIDFAFVKEHASFEPVLAHYNLQLVGRGKDGAVLCPFHKERKPSCKIELERRVFHCFGCEAKGNLLEFVARMESDPKDLRAAALKVAAICKIATAPPRRHAAKAAAPAGNTQERASTGKADNDNERPAAAKPATESKERT